MAREGSEATVKWDESSMKRSPIRRKRAWIKAISSKKRKRMAVNRKLCDRWWAEGNTQCRICGLRICTREDLVPDHIMPGTAKDDSEQNKQPAHTICNNLKGSKRNYTREQCLRDLGLLPRLSSYTQSTVIARVRKRNADTDGN